VRLRLRAPRWLRRGDTASGEGPPSDKPLSHGSSDAPEPSAPGGHASRTPPEHWRALVARHAPGLLRGEGIGLRRSSPRHALPLPSLPSLPNAAPMSRSKPLAPVESRPTARPSRVRSPAPSAGVEAGADRVVVRDRVDAVTVARTAWAAASSLRRDRTARSIVVRVVPEPADKAGPAPPPSRREPVQPGVPRTPTELPVRVTTLAVAPRTPAPTPLDGRIHDATIGPVRSREPWPEPAPELYSSARGPVVEDQPAVGRLDEFGKTAMPPWPALPPGPETRRTVAGGTPRSSSYAPNGPASRETPPPLGWPDLPDDATLWVVSPALTGADRRERLDREQAGF
jgi:hypothetical protein